MFKQIKAFFKTKKDDFVYDWTKEQTQTHNECKLPINILASQIASLSCSGIYIRYSNSNNIKNGGL